MFSPAMRVGVVVRTMRHDSGREKAASSHNSIRAIDFRRTGFRWLARNGKVGKGCAGFDKFGLTTYISI
jgi:hypothetical protein